MNNRWPVLHIRRGQASVEETAVLLCDVHVGRAKEKIIETDFSPFSENPHTCKDAAGKMNTFIQSNKCIDLFIYLIHIKW